MQLLTRKPFQGLYSVIKFNWHFYVFAFAIIIILFFCKSSLNHSLQNIITVIILFSVASIFTSLFVTFYVYDYSNFYTLDWLKDLQLKDNSSIINIHAGFDETSVIIQHKFHPSNFVVFDFYDAKKHTEISIQRARKNADVFPGTTAINTERFQYNSHADYVFLLLAAHEIRNDKERIQFLKTLHSLLNVDGKIIVAEHVRNIPNFIAYTVGAFHFLSKQVWKTTFDCAGFNRVSEIKINPFITAFVLYKE